MTLIEEFATRLYEGGLLTGSGNQIQELVDKFKEIEKEQSINDFISGMEFIAVDPNKYKEDAEKYYNETYGGNK